MAAKKRLPYIPFYTADFMAGTRFLSHLARSVYIQLLCIEWDIGPLPGELIALERVVQGTREAWPELESKFQIDENGRLFNARLEAERAKSMGISQKRAAIGSLGGNAKAASKRLANATAIGVANALANGVAKVCHSDSDSDSDSDRGASSLRSEAGETPPAKRPKKLAENRFDADGISLTDEWRNKLAIEFPLVTDINATLAEIAAYWSENPTHAPKPANFWTKLRNQLDTKNTLAYRAKPNGKAHGPPIDNSELPNEHRSSRSEWAAKKLRDTLDPPDVRPAWALVVRWPDELVYDRLKKLLDAAASKSVPGKWLAAVIPNEPTGYVRAGESGAL